MCIRDRFKLVNMLDVAPILVCAWIEINQISNAFNPESCKKCGTLFTYSCLLYTSLCVVNVPVVTATRFKCYI